MVMVSFPTGSILSAFDRAEQDSGGYAQSPVEHPGYVAGEIERHFQHEGVEVLLKRAHLVLAHLVVIRVRQQVQQISPDQGQDSWIFTKASMPDSLM